MFFYKYFLCRSNMYSGLFLAYPHIKAHIPFHCTLRKNQFLELISVYIYMYIYTVLISGETNNLNTNHKEERGTNTQSRE